MHKHKIRTVAALAWLAAMAAPVVAAQPQQSASSSGCPLADPSLVKVTPAADLPCASVDPSIAFSVSPWGGVQEGDAIGGLSADLFVPLNDSFALQVDGDVGGWKGSGVFGQVGGHALMMLPDLGSIGAYSSLTSYGDGNQIVRLGGEAYVDFGQFSLSAVGGWKSEGRHHAFVDSRLGFDFTDDTRAYVGYAYDEGSSLGLGLEHDVSKTDDTTATVFLRGNVHSSRSASALIGMRLQFGNTMKSNCETSGGRNMSPIHWSLARKVIQAKAATPPPPPPTDVVTACTFAQAADQQNLPSDSSCTVSGTPTGNVVNGDISRCSGLSESCPVITACTVQDVFDNHRELDPNGCTIDAWTGNVIDGSTKECNPTSWSCF